MTIFCTSNLGILHHRTECLFQIACNVVKPEREREKEKGRDEDRERKRGREGDR